MENLKEVEIIPESLPPSICTYRRSRQGDDGFHRAGLCCVNIGTIYQNCPKQERFMGVEVGSIPQTLTFRKWNSRVKKSFYQDFLSIITSKHVLLDKAQLYQARKVGNEVVQVHVLHQQHIQPGHVKSYQSSKPTVQ